MNSALPLLQQNFESTSTNKYETLSFLVSFIKRFGKWIILIISCIGGACTGVFFYYMQMECQLLKNAWRLLLTCFLIMPFVVQEFKNGIQKKSLNWEILKDRENWKLMMMACLGHSVWSVGLLIAVNHTTMAHAYLFHSMHTIIISGYKYSKGQALIKEEIFGTLMTTIGAIFLALDHDIGTSSIVDLASQSAWERFILGDMVAFLSALGGAVFFTKSHELKNEFPTYFRVAIMSFIGFCIVALMSFVLEGANFSFDTNKGIFGLFTAQWFGIGLLNAIVCGLGAYVCYNLATKYFDPLLVSVVSTAEPVVSALLVFFIGWQSFPGILTWLGFALILPSIIIISYGYQKIQAQKAKLINSNYLEGNYIELKEISCK